MKTRAIAQPSPNPARTSKFTRLYYATFVPSCILLLAYHYTLIISKKKNFKRRTFQKIIFYQKTLN